MRFTHLNILLSTCLLSACTSTRPDGRVIHRYFGYTAITEQPLARSGQAKDIRNAGFVVSRQTGLALGYTHEQSAIIPPGRALYIYLPADASPDPILKLLKDAGIKDAAVITFPSSNPTHNQP